VSRQWSSLNAILTCLAVILRFTFFRVLEIEMAIFGFNLTLTVIGVFFLRKLIPILNLPPRFLKGFYRFLPPSEQMLRETNNQPAKKTLGGNVKKRKNQEPEKKDFVVNKVKFQSYWQNVENSSNCFFRNSSAPGICQWYQGGCKVGRKSNCVSCEITNFFSNPICVSCEL